MTTATIAMFVSVIAASIWAGIMTWVLSQGVTRSLECAIEEIESIETDQTVLAPVYQAPSRRVATLRAMNHLPSLYDMSTNDIEPLDDSDSISTHAVTALTVFSK